MPGHTINSQNNKVCMTFSFTSILNQQALGLGDVSITRACKADALYRYQQAQVLNSEACANMQSEAQRLYKLAGKAWGPSTTCHVNQSPSVVMTSLCSAHAYLGFELLVFQLH
jgi:hypothetical protein